MVFPILRVVGVHDHASTYDEAVERARAALAADPSIGYVLVCETVAEVRPLTDSVVIPHPRLATLE